MTIIDGGRTYTTHEAARVAGVTYRQATYWACTLRIFGDDLAGRGPGHPLTWTAVDVTALAAVAAYARLVDPHGNGSPPIGAVGPAIVTAVRACVDPVWLTIDLDQHTTAHRTLSDAVRAVTLRGGLLIDLTPTR